MNPSRSAARILCLLIRLYPADFRHEYGEELEGVLRQMAQDTDSWPPVPRLRRYGLEALALLSGAAHAHAHWKWLMSPLAPPPASVIRQIIWAIGLTYGVIRLVAYVSPWPDLVTYLAGGVLAGLWLQAITSDRQSGAWIMAGIGLFLGGAGLAGLARLALVWFAGEPGILTFAGLYLLEPLVVCGLTGALLGALDHSRRRLIVLGGVGLAGFLGGLVPALALTLLSWGLVQAVDSYRPVNDGVSSAWVFLVGQSLLAILLPSLTVLIGGLILGRTACSSPHAPGPPAQS